MINEIGKCHSSLFLLRIQPDLCVLCRGCQISEFCCAVVIKINVPSKVAIILLNSH